MLARERKWLPDQVDACPAEFIDEVIAEITARADHALFSIQDADSDTKQQQTRRKLDIMKWRKAETF